MKVWVLILLFTLSFGLPLLGKEEARRVNFIGFVDKNKDGMNDLFRDANGDGVNDVNGLPYPHMFGFRDDNKDSINDIFVDANGDGINDYDDSFADKNGDGINDNVIDADGDNRNDITGRIVTRYKAEAKRINAKRTSWQESGKVLHKGKEEIQPQTDVFIDRGDGFNELLKEDKKESLFNFLSRSIGGYLGTKSKQYISDTRQPCRRRQPSSRVVSKERETSSKPSVLRPKKETSQPKSIKVTKKSTEDKEEPKKTK